MFYQLTTEWRESGLRPYLCTFPLPLDEIYNPPVPFRLAGSAMVPVTTRHEPHWRLMATNDTQFWMTRGKWRRTLSSNRTGWYGGVRPQSKCAHGKWDDYVNRDKHKPWKNWKIESENSLCLIKLTELYLFFELKFDKRTMKRKRMNHLRRLFVFNWKIIQFTFTILTN